MTRQALLLYCQSSLGIGHTVRSLRLAAGLAKAFDVQFLNGGEPIGGFPVPPGVRLIQLPPFSTDEEFQALQAPPGMSVDEAFDERSRIIMNTYEETSPAVVLTELYPFGRGQFGRELKPLLKAARRDRVATASSVRDILVARKDPAAYEAKVVDLMNRFFDMLLIHGDPRLCSLGESFSRLGELQAEILYTGYVVPKPEGAPARRAETIVASIGGGRFGHELAEAVVAAAPLLAERIPHRINLYTGPFCPANVEQRLRAAARGQRHLSVERFVPDLAQRIQAAALSISMGGYNSTMDVLATGVRAMMMGCANNSGMDQVARVEELGRLGVIEVIRAEDLAPSRFAQRVVEALAREPSKVVVDLDGVDATRRALQRLAGRATARPATRIPSHA